MTFGTRCIRTRSLPLLIGVAVTLGVAPTWVPGGHSPEVDSIDPKLLARLTELDAVIASMDDITAKFTERKFTTLLKEPLVSTGLVRIVGSRARWDTHAPHRTITVMDQRRIRIYFPDRAALEVYEIGERLGWLAVLPLPRLAILRKHFRIEPLGLDTFGEKLRPGDHLAFRLRPKDDSLRDYVERVDIVVDVQTACVVQAEMTDADGDRTVLLFRDVKTNTGLNETDVELVVPDGTRTTRMLGGPN